MNQSRNFVVGAFVVVMFVAFLLWIALLSGRSGTSDSFHAYYDNVTGVSAGTQVLYEGYGLGIVDGVTPSPGGPGRFRVDLSLEQGFPVPSDSVARIMASGLLSAVVIDIAAGSSPSALEPGAEIRGEVSMGMAAALSSVASELMRLIDENIVPLLDELTAQTPEVLSKANQLTGELNEIAQRVNALVGPENSGRIDRILVNLEDTSTGLESFTKEIQGTEKQLEELLDSVNAMVEENRPNVSQSLLDLRDLLEAMVPRVDAITRNLEVTTRHLSEFSLQVRENPSVIVRGRNAGESEE